MRVLHLLSNWKWTGPAEPALNLCVALRRMGVEADFACAAGPGEAINKVVETARDRGVEPILSLRLAKHYGPLRNWLDAGRLRRVLAGGRYDAVHCHLDNDHRIAAGPARAAGLPLVRSSYHGPGFPDTRAARRLVASATRIIEPSEAARRHDVEVLGYPADRAVVVPGAVDTGRFDPAREVPDARRWLGIAPTAFVVGIVARLQTHRHYEDFFEAVRLLGARHPDVRVIVVGRGTRQESVGFEPVRRLGLEGAVSFPGYVDGENYVGMLRAFDVKVFLVPGTDGTCRAVREAMAMGKPAVVSDRGMLPELVEDGRTGYVCDGSPRALFEALCRLREDRALAHALGRAARGKAVTDFSLDAQAGRVRAVYESLG